MKRLLLALVAFLLKFSLVNAQLSDMITSNGYTFVKEWTDDFNSKGTDWYIADWTFNDNACEFGNQGLKLENGELFLTISKKDAGDMGSAPSKQYWGGEYWNSNQYLYGRYVIKMKPNTPSGVVTSFFLMNIEWNEDYSVPLEWSEIDIEFAGKTNEVQFTLHWIDENGVKKMDPNTVQLTKSVTDAYHEWVIEWTPTYISYYLDGEKLFTFDDPAVLAEQARPQEIHMNHWVSIHPSWVGTLDENNLPITTTYDQITYYRLDEVNEVNKVISDANKIWYSHADKSIYINGPKNISEYIISDVNGNIVLKGVSEGSEINIGNSLTPGMYFVQLLSDNKVSHNKIIIK